MTPTQWNALDELIRRRHVLAVGLSEETLDAVTRVVQSGDEVERLPARTIAAIRLQRADGHKARLFYFKRTVSVLLPKEFRAATEDNRARA